MLRKVIVNVPFEYDRSKRFPFRIATIHECFSWCFKEIDIVKIYFTFLRWSKKGNVNEWIYIQGVKFHYQCFELRIDNNHQIPWRFCKSVMDEEIIPFFRECIDKTNISLIID